MNEARDTRPSRAMEWAIDTFGDCASDPKERALRFVEEAIEVAIAMKIPANTLTMLIVRAIGSNGEKGSDIAREIGQAQMTLECLAHVLGHNASDLAEDELRRVKGLDPEIPRQSHLRKERLGLTGSVVAGIKRSWK